MIDPGADAGGADVVDRARVAVVAERAVYSHRVGASAARGVTRPRHVAGIGRRARHRNGEVDATGRRIAGIDSPKMAVLAFGPDT
jgi:hypothetical protein